MKITSGDTVLMDEDRTHPNTDPFTAYAWFVNFLRGRGDKIGRAHV